MLFLFSAGICFEYKNDHKGQRIIIREKLSKKNDGAIQGFGCRFLFDRYKVTIFEK